MSLMKLSDTPLYLYSNATFFETKQTLQQSTMEIITINQSENLNFSLKVGSLDLYPFGISTTNDNKYKVLLFPNLMNPYLSLLPKEIEVKLLCKFFYPVAATGRNGIHQCWVSFRGKSSNEITLGSCKLHLLTTSCFCVITATVVTDQLETLKEIVFSAMVTYCSESTCTAKSRRSLLQYLATSKLRLPLGDSDKLIWMRSFYNESLNVGLLVGLPRISLDRQKIFELPIAFTPSPVNRKIYSIQIS